MGALCESSWVVGLRLLSGFGVDQEVEHVADPGESTEEHQHEADDDLLPL